MKSIIQEEKECYITHGTEDLHEHHIFFGKNRKLSEKYGLKVWLTYEYHESDKGVHGKNGHGLDMLLKSVAQREFEKTHTRQEFMQIFGKNYLD